MEHSMLYKVQIFLSTHLVMPSGGNDNNNDCKQFRPQVAKQQDRHVITYTTCIYPERIFGYW